MSRRDREGNLGMGSTVVCIWKILPQMGEGTSRKCVYVRVETERPWDEMVVVVVDGPSPKDVRYSSMFLLEL